MVAALGAQESLLSNGGTAAKQMASMVSTAHREGQECALEECVTICNADAGSVASVVWLQSGRQRRSTSEDTAEMDTCILMELCNGGSLQVPLPPPPTYTHPKPHRSRSRTIMSSWVLLGLLPSGCNAVT